MLFCLTTSQKKPKDSNNFVRTKLEHEQSTQVVFLFVSVTSQNFSSFEETESWQVFLFWLWSFFFFEFSKRGGFIRPRLIKSCSSVRYFLTVFVHYFHFVLSVIMICVSVLSTCCALSNFEQFWHSHVFAGKKKTDQHKSSETQDRSCNKEQAFQFRDRSDKQKKEGQSQRKRTHKQTTEQNAKKTKSSVHLTNQSNTQVRYFCFNIAQISKLLGVISFWTLWRRCSKTHMTISTHFQEEKKVQHNKNETPSYIQHTTLILRVHDKPEFCVLLQSFKTVRLPKK